MRRLTLNPHSAWLAVALVCLACAGGANLAHATGSKSSGSVVKESQQTFEKQLAAGEIKSAALKPRRHLLHIKLVDRRHLTVQYTGSVAHVRKELRAHDVAISSVKAPGHKTRYIVGGALVAALILALIGLLVWRRRRRAALEAY